MTRCRQRAREHFARALERQGPGWASAASSVRSGYENIWIKAGIDAVEAVLLQLGDDEDPE